MSQTKTLILSKNQIISITQFGTLLAVALLAPLLHSQLITGSIVNAVLFYAAFALGWQAAITIGVLPSLIALLSGTLPLPLLPMIPFIITSNAILTVVFFLLKKKSYFIGAVSAAFLKFVFLATTSSVLINAVFHRPIAEPIVSMMLWPQLITALLGTLLAYGIIKILNRSKVAL